jgi:hypothetical protein
MITCKRPQKYALIRPQYVSLQLVNKFDGFRKARIVASAVSLT